jgi:hypothetical protein
MCRYKEVPWDVTQHPQHALIPDAALQQLLSHHVVSKSGVVVHHARRSLWPICAQDQGARSGFIIAPTAFGLRHSLGLGLQRELSRTLGPKAQAERGKALRGDAELVEASNREQAAMKPVLSCLCIA